MRSPANTAVATFVAGVLVLVGGACAGELPSGPAARQTPAKLGLEVSALAVPANDDFDNATAITALPFTSTLDITEATIADDDPLHDETCGFEPIDGQTVWYQFTPSVNLRVVASTNRTIGFDPPISVYTGARGALTCAVSGVLPTLASFDAIAGTTYYLVAGSAEFDPGGTLSLFVDKSLEVGVTIDPVGTINLSTGVATISGTVTCSRSAFFELGGSVAQRKAEVSQGGLFASFDCDGVTHWEGEVAAESGRLLPGRAEVTAGALFTDNATTEEVHGVAEPTTVRLIPTAASGLVRLAKPANAS
jgi:hypothetical protein